MPTSAASGTSPGDPNASFATLATAAIPATPVKNGDVRANRCSHEVYQAAAPGPPTAKESRRVSAAPAACALIVIYSPIAVTSPQHSTKDGRLCNHLVLILFQTVRAGFATDGLRNASGEPK